MAGVDYRNPNRFYDMQKRGLATNGPLFALPPDFTPINFETEEEEEEEDVVEGSAAKEREELEEEEGVESKYIPKLAEDKTPIGLPPANWKIHEVQSLGFTGDVIQTSVRSDGRVIRNGNHAHKITYFTITNATDVYNWVMQQPTVPRPNGSDMPERSVAVWNTDTNTIIVSKLIAVQPDMPLENITGSETVESYPEGERDRSLTKLETEADKIYKEEETVVGGERSVFGTSLLTTDVERKQTRSPQVWVIRQSEMRGKDRIITYVSSDGNVVENSNSVDYSLHFKISNPQEIYDWVKEQKDAPLENNVKRLVKVWSLNARKIVIDKRISGSEKPLPFKKDPRVEEKKTDYDSEELKQFDRIVDEDVGIEIFALNPKSESRPMEPAGATAVPAEYSSSQEWGTPESEAAALKEVLAMVKLNPLKVQRVVDKAFVDRLTPDEKEQLHKARQDYWGTPKKEIARLAALVLSKYENESDRKSLLDNGNLPTASTSASAETKVMEPTGGETVCEKKRMFAKPTSGDVMSIQLCIWGEDPKEETASPAIVNVYYQMWQSELELWNEIRESKEARAFIAPDIVRPKPTSASLATFLVVFVPPGRSPPRANTLEGWKGVRVLNMKFPIPLSIFEVLASKPDLDVVVQQKRFLIDHPEGRKNQVAVRVHFSDMLQSGDSQTFMRDTFWPALKRAAAMRFAYEPYVVNFLTQTEEPYDVDLFVRSTDKKDSSRATTGNKIALLNYVDRTQSIGWQVDSIADQIAKALAVRAKVDRTPQASSTTEPLRDIFEHRHEFHSQVEFLSDQTATKATSEQKLKKLQKQLDLESADELFTIRLTLASGTHDQYISVQVQPTETSMYVGDNLEHSVRRVIVDETKEYKTHPAIVQARVLYAMGTFRSYELVVGVGIVDNSDLTYDASKITEKSGNTSVIQLFAAKLIANLKSLQPVVTEGLTNTVRTIHSQEVANSTPSSSSWYVDQNWEASAAWESTWRKARTSTSSKRPFFIVLSDALVPKYLEMEKAQASKDNMEAKLDPQHSLRILLTQSAKVQKEARSTTEVNNAWPFVLSVPLDQSLDKNDVAEMRIILKAVRLRLDQLFLQERRFDASIASGVLTNDI